MEAKKNPKKRVYPPFYEMAVPIALGIIGFGVFALLVISLIVALGLFPGGN